MQNRLMNKSEQGQDGNFSNRLFLNFQIHQTVKGHWFSNKDHDIHPGFEDEMSSRLFMRVRNHHRKYFHPSSD